MFGFKSAAIGKQLDRKTMMSEEKDREKKDIIKAPLNKTLGSVNGLGAINTETQRYTCRLDQIDPNAMQGDNVSGLILNLIPLVGEKKRFIDINSFTSILIGYADSSFGLGYGVKIHQIDGMLDPTGLPTNVVMTSSASQISTTSAMGQLVNYTVLYKETPGSNLWQITGIPKLTFTLCDLTTQSPIFLPMLQPVIITFDIVRVIV